MPILPPLPLTIRTLTDEEGHRLDMLDPNIPLPENCITCLGTKKYFWWTPTRSEMVTWDCNCIDQWILNRYLRHSGIGVYYQRLGWFDLHLADPAAIAMTKEFIENDISIRQGVGLILQGDMGMGKTALSALAAKALLAKGYDVYFTSFTSMLDNFSSTWKSEEEKKWFYRRVKNCQILFIDDIGRENTSKLSIPTFDDVLRHRVASGTVTCLSTNIMDLAQKYQMNIFRLLEESSNVLIFKDNKNEDIMAKVKDRRTTETKMRAMRPIVIG
jgi:DNA replication protein DnaC